jgi:hypothetical protein
MHGILNIRVIVCLTFSVLRTVHMFWRPLIVCSLNYVTETVQLTKGSMLASPALVDGCRCSAGRAASVLTALVYGHGIAPQYTIILMD